ncbi:MAG TPA: UDP-N-acetylglucosamine 2-epimerase (non-hydrolyzing) [Rhizomicrobium sp.]|nr:UDP-N-acetylglucosamine 2-epimerase (non-hydrolyzing) [Rhizomicrobium sp.]
MQQPAQKVPLPRAETAEWFMKHFLIIVGTRPEAIKMAPLVCRLRDSGEFRVTLCSSGQHREMINQVFNLFALQPDISLDVMQANQALGELTARVVTGVENIIAKDRPDRVLVHGDTTTTMAATLAAFYHKVPVGHVEAGLRTGNLCAPWPEEMNRKVTDAIADRLYAPTQTARDNLLREGAEPSRILVTGNTVIDALFDILKGPLAESKVHAELKGCFPFLDDDKRMILVTCHRRESYGRGFEDVCSALEELAKRRDIQVVFPIHRNPNVRTIFQSLDGTENVHLVEPVDYLEFVFLMSRCHLVLTDSGGIQEEAPSLGKPVLVLREVTERPEAVQAGTVKLVGTDQAAIVASASQLLDDEDLYTSMSTRHNPYGDGLACERILASLREDVDDSGR